MKKTHKKSRIVQFHHTSDTAKKLLNITFDSGMPMVVLQIEPIEHAAYDFIAEIMSKTDYEKWLEGKENAEL